VYSNQRSTAEARRATTFTCTSLPLSIPCFYCVHLAYYSSPPAVIVVAVTGSCIFVFSRQNPPSLGASRTKSSIGIALQLSESGSLDYATLPCLALRRLLPHLPLYTTLHSPPPPSLACCLRLWQYISHRCSDRTRFISCFRYSSLCLRATMPARAADLDEALQKKGGLTLSQLANYDDLITDALVDRVSLVAGLMQCSSRHKKLISSLPGLLLVRHSQAEAQLPPLPRHSGGGSMQDPPVRCNHKQGRHPGAS
jgi:hypothetical protein